MSIFISVLKRKSIKTMIEKQITKDQKKGGYLIWLIILPSLYADFTRMKTTNSIFCLPIDYSIILTACPPVWSRKEEVVLSRLCIDQTRFTYSYLLKEEVQPIWHACQTAYSIKHILIEFIDPAPSRERFYNVRSMKVLFNKKINGCYNVLLKAVGLYGKC